MKTAMKKLALGGLFLLAAGAVSAEVTVTYVHPENFRDMPFAPTDREQILKDVSDHFARLGKELPAGQDLRVEILDLDLAGRLHPNFRGAQDIRVMRGGADWPHMQLRYTIEENGRVLRSGESQLADMMYMDHLNRYSSGDPLRYEKQMIDDWFKKTILAPRAG